MQRFWIAVAVLGFGTTQAKSAVSFIKPQQTAVLTGNDVKALAIAYGDWSRNVAKGKYAISNQFVIVNHFPGYILIRFVPKGGEGLLGGTSKFGRITHYIINLPGTRIEQRTFPE